MYGKAKIFERVCNKNAMPTIAFVHDIYNTIYYVHISRGRKAKSQTDACVANALLRIYMSVDLYIYMIHPK